MSEEKAPYGKQEPPFPKLIETLRQRLDLSPNDASQDDEIRKYSCKRALEEMCAWHMGGASWAETVLSWAEDAGYQIKDREEKEVEERVRRKSDEELTWEIGRNENAKRQLWDIMTRMKNALSCLEKPKP